MDKDPLYWKAQEKALQYLDYKLRTGAEVRKKLLEKEFPEPIVSQVLDFLLHYGYVNDAYYCECYIRDSQRFHPKGKMRLQRELLQRGVAREVVEVVLEETETDEVAAAVALLAKKVKPGMALGPKEKQRLSGFLQRRGYGWPTVREAFARLEESMRLEE